MTVKELRSIINMDDLNADFAVVVWDEDEEGNSTSLTLVLDGIDAGAEGAIHFRLV